MPGNFRGSDESLNHNGCSVVGRLCVQYYHCAGFVAARGANEVVFIAIWWIDNNNNKSITCYYNNLLTRILLPKLKTIRITISFFFFTSVGDLRSVLPILSQTVLYRYLAIYVRNFHLEIYKKKCSIFFYIYIHFVVIK